MGFLAHASSLGPAPLPGFLSSLAGPLDHYGYWVIALTLLLENMGIPVVPGEFALIGGAIFAGSGRAGLNIVVVGVIAVVASVAGAEIGYLIGRFAGRELILRYGRYIFIKPHHLDRAEAIVDRYGGIVIIIARYIVGLREANGIIAGITQMRWFTFTLFNVIGACLWVATWVTVGAMAGDHIDEIYNGINRYSLYLLIALAILLAGYVGWRLLRGRRRASERRETSGVAEGPVTAETSVPQPSFDDQDSSLADQDPEVQEDVPAPDDNVPAPDNVKDRQGLEVNGPLEASEDPAPRQALDDRQALEVNGPLEASEDPAPRQALEDSKKSSEARGGA